MFKHSHWLRVPRTSTGISVVRDHFVPQRKERLNMFKLLNSCQYVFIHVNPFLAVLQQENVVQLCWIKFNMSMFVQEFNMNMYIDVEIGMVEHESTCSNN